MLHQAGLLGVAARQSEQSLNDLEDELRVDDSLVSFRCSFVVRSSDISGKYEGGRV